MSFLFPFLDILGLCFVTRIRKRFCNWVASRSCAESLCPTRLSERTVKNVNSSNFLGESKRERRGERKEKEGKTREEKLSATYSYSWSSLFFFFFLFPHLDISCFRIVPIFKCPYCEFMLSEYALFTHCQTAHKTQSPNVVITSPKKEKSSSNTFSNCWWRHQDVKNDAWLRHRPLAVMTSSMSNVMKSFALFWWRHDSSSRSVPSVRRDLAAIRTMWVRTFSLTCA